MEKNSTMTCGVDIGDRFSHICVLDDAGEVIEETRVRTTSVGFTRYFNGRQPQLVALEVGTHSPWVSNLVAALGHEVLVANARKLRMIYENEMKDDRVDAEMLARVARMDPKLLAPIQHRGDGARAALGVIRSRDALVRTRASLVSHVRGMVKAFGARLPSCTTARFGKLVGQLPEQLQPALTPVMETIIDLSRRIADYDRRIEHEAQAVAEVVKLRQIPGVGALTAMAFVLTLEEPERFPRSRSVGAYLGLVPRRDQSGDANPQLRITKTGDSYLRRLLVGSAHYVLGPFGPDSDLRRWGMRLAERGGKNAKRRAAVAVARKLAVIMHRMWLTGADYVLLREADHEQQ